MSIRDSRRFQEQEHDSVSSAIELSNRQPDHPASGSKAGIVPEPANNVEQDAQARLDAEEFKLPPKASLILVVSANVLLQVCRFVISIEQRTEFEAVITYELNRSHSSLSFRRHMNMHTTWGEPPHSLE